MRPTRILYAGGRALVKNQPQTNKNLKRKNSLKSHTQIEPQTAIITSVEPTRPRGSPEADDRLDGFFSSSSQSTNFSGRVHSESYSADNLSAAFDSILSSSSKLDRVIEDHPRHTDDRTQTTHDQDSTQTFLSAVKNSTLSTLQTYRQSILESLAKDDPNGRIYSKNVRQMKDILTFERWRKKLERTLNLSVTPHLDHPIGQQNIDSSDQDLTVQYPLDSSKSNHKSSDDLVSPERFILSSLSHLTSSSKNGLSVRKELVERPTISDPTIVQKLIHEFWKLDRLLIDGTVLVAYSGYPTLIDELLKLKNVKKVIAIEEKPEYCIMYTERWKQAVENKRLFHIKNDGYWWESYSEIEEEGLLDDVQIEPWNKLHPSLFFISQLPHNKRSIQFIMQLVSFIPNRNWLFQYGRVGLGFIGSGDLCRRLTREQTEKKYTRITAAANCLTDIQTPPVTITDSLTADRFFPSNLILNRSSSSSPSSSKNQSRTTRSSPTKPVGTKTKTKKIYKSSPEAQPTAFASSLLLCAKADLSLTPDESDCLNFLQRVMFIHSAQSWVESISHAAAGASIMYDKLKELDDAQKAQRDSRPGSNDSTENGDGDHESRFYIPRSKTPRSFSDQDWINLAKAFNRWPFRPRSFENDLELDLDDGSGT